MILHTSRFVTVFATGLLAGILFGDRMGASFARPTLPAASFVQFQQVQHLRFVPMMPILMGLAIVASVAWLVSVRSQFRSIGFGLLALATIGVGAVMVLTRAVNVPINEELMT